MNFITNIFKYFGFVPVQQLRELEIENESLKVKSKLFERPETKAQYHEFEPDPDSKYTVFQQYWITYCEPDYNAWYLRKLSLHPELIKPFLLEFTIYDWKDTADFMKEVNWHWSSNKCSPSISDLQSNVLSLLHSCLDDRWSGQRVVGFTDDREVSSGGFTVSIRYDNGYKVKIDFDKSLAYEY